MSIVLIMLLGFWVGTVEYRLRKVNEVFRQNALASSENSMMSFDEGLGRCGISEDTYDSTDYFPYGAIT